ncbi:MAG: sugar ABC transporter ATP-binding protein [Corynebacterium sp.]|uniref:sugar ABC transporter ATP-binding protein n=1 Tax=Corynebacterium sp. TaxID=1720 RepID=UPI0026DBE0E6|nr:sugar ABC transporter ATP-binding protein [Corynebacterium sp.]MDO4761553.1 sugar ABC transporter ATP-binding protein [Corynebacterium sp.]
MHTATDIPEPVLSLVDVCKSFGPVNVIDHVSVHVRPGRVLALLGENGAGKSTLIKMMSGVYQPDSGQIIVDGKPTRLPTAKAAEALGIATIHQELNLVPTMSVAENVMLGRAPRRFGLVNFSRLRAEARAALDLIGVDVDLDTPMQELGIAHQQMVEIAKALSVNARILILDEPTAALTDREVEQLFRIIRQLKARGVAMVFISHHLDEIAAIADTVSVLRDGHFIAEVPATTSEDELVRLMVGREIDNQFPKHTTAHGPVVLDVRDLSASGKYHDVSFRVHAGEIVGIAGLVGAGRTELLRGIVGADHRDHGEVLIDATTIKPNDIRAAIHAGIGLVPEDRKAQGLVLDASVNDNLGLATFRSTARFRLVDRSGQRQRATQVADSLRIKMASMSQPVRNLSGGNQQKVVFGRWVLAGSKVLLLDEPTRGVDVGAKVEIYTLINQIIADGGAVVMVSSELPEILGMSDRILVMSSGRLVGELPPTATQDEIMSLAVSNVAHIIKDHSDTHTDTHTEGKVRS